MSKCEHVLLSGKNKGLLCGKKGEPKPDLGDIIGESYFQKIVSIMPSFCKNHLIMFLRNELRDSQTLKESEPKILLSKEELNRRKRVKVIARLMSSYVGERYFIGNIEQIDGVYIKLENIDYEFRTTQDWSWKNIKFTLDNVLKDDGTLICCVCLESKKRLTCNICYSPLCYKCWRNILVVNKGVDICPLCKYTIGIELDQIGLQQFLYNTDYYWLGNRYKDDVELKSVMIDKTNDHWVS